LSGGGGECGGAERLRACGGLSPFEVRRNEDAGFGVTGAVGVGGPGGGGLCQVLSAGLSDGLAGEGAWFQGWSGWGPEPEHGGWGIR